MGLWVETVPEECMAGVAGIRQGPLGLPPTALFVKVWMAGSSDLVIRCADLTTLHRALWSRALQLPTRS